MGRAEQGMICAHGVFLEGRGIEQRMNFGGQPTLCLGHFFIRNKNTIVIIIIIIIIIIINIPTVCQIYFRKMNETVKVHPESFYLAFKADSKLFSYYLPYSLQGGGQPINWRYKCDTF